MMAIATTQRARAVHGTPAPTDVPHTAAALTPGRTQLAHAIPAPPARQTRPHRQQHTFPNEAIAIIAIANPGTPHDRRTVNRTPFQMRRSS